MSVSTSPRRRRTRKRKYAFRVRPSRPSTSRQETIALKKGVLAIIALTAVICLGLIVAAAWGAAINYENNQIRAENKALAGEVESLRIEIETDCNVASVESKATKDLDMEYAKGESYVVIKHTKEPSGKLAMQLKEQAFN